MNGTTVLRPPTLPEGAADPAMPPATWQPPGDADDVRQIFPAIQNWDSVDWKRADEGLDAVLGDDDHSAAFLADPTTADELAQDFHGALKQLVNRALRSAGSNVPRRIAPHPTEASPMHLATAAPPNALVVSLPAGLPTAGAGAQQDVTGIQAGYEVSILRDELSPPGQMTTAESTWPGRLRHIVRAVLHSWNLSHLVDDEVQLTTELVTNAFRYGRGPNIGYRLCLTDRRLWTEVQDGSPDVPVLRHASVTEESGRGLLLVSGMAANWGVSDDGTRTWCYLLLDETGATEPRPATAAPGTVEP